MLETVKTYALLGLAIGCVTLSLSTCEYRRQYKSTALALDVQNKAIDAQNKEAERVLKSRTAERDALQKQINETAEAQEKKDVATRKVLAQAALDAEREPTVIRVRVPAGNAGCSGGGGASKAGAATGAGAPDPYAFTGLLAPEAERRFKSAVTEIETLQAAFNSCKASSK